LGKRAQINDDKERGWGGGGTFFSGGVDASTLRLWGERKGVTTDTKTLASGKWDA